MVYNFRIQVCINNLISITPFLNTANFNGHKVDMIYFDMSKAFDRVDHFILAKKLYELSLPYLLYSTESTAMQFVIGRQYILKADGAETNIKFNTKSSVPQGSHCGPLLFLIMINDVNMCICENGTKLLQYADDEKLYQIVYSTVNSCRCQLIILSCGPNRIDCSSMQIKLFICHTTATG